MRAPRPGTDRVSIPYFLNPALNALVPIISLPPDLAALSRGVEADPDNPNYRIALQRSMLIDEIGEEHVLPTLDSAIERANEELEVRKLLGPNEQTPAVA